MKILKIFGALTKELGIVTVMLAIAYFNIYSAFSDKADGIKIALIISAVLFGLSIFIKAFTVYDELKD